MESIFSLSRTIFSEILIVAIFPDKNELKKESSNLM